MSVISKLLIRNVSKGQTVSYLLANFIGLTIILAALQIHADLAPAIDGEDIDPEEAYFGNDYLVLTKKLNSLSALGVGESRFSTAEVEDISSQPWAKKTGNFRAADFSVYASVNIGGKDLSTALFLEAVPDEFIDRRPDGWSFDPTRAGIDPVPVIIPADYLALYNFGFAPSRGLPQVSDEVVKLIPISIIMVGNGRREAVPAKIVGFSKRLNTIAAPEEFIQWANNRFSTPNATSAEDASRPSRLIIATPSAGDPAVQQYLSSHGYEEAGNNIETGKASFFLSVITGLIAGIGVIISILAIIILMLSVFLLIQKNRLKINQLMTLGYTPKTISACYFRLIATVNVTVLAAASLALWLLSGWWRSLMEALDIRQPSIITTLLIGLIAISLVTAFNFLVVNRMIKKCFR